MAIWTFFTSRIPPLAHSPTPGGVPGSAQKAFRMVLRGKKRRDKLPRPPSTPTLGSATACPRSAREPLRMVLRGKKRGV